jgi:hypothetical protein
VNVFLNTLAVSNSIIIVTGINAPAPISITGGLSPEKPRVQRKMPSRRRQQLDRTH